MMQRKLHDCLTSFRVSVMGVRIRLQSAEYDNAAYVTDGTSLSLLAVRSGCAIVRGEDTSGSTQVTATHQ